MNGFGLSRTGRLVGPPLLVAISIAALRRFPPELYPWLPACPFHRWTGLLCPGCGATRALAHLAAGDLHGALAANALVCLLLPPGLAYGVFGAYRICREQPLSSLPPVVAAALVAVSVAFAVVRNLHS